MNGTQTILHNPEDPEEPKKFTFDYSYWSHDGFVEQEDGYLAASNPNYCDQVSCNSESTIMPNLLTQISVKTSRRKSSGRSRC